MGSPTARWQKITLLTLFTGYAGYYVCRANLAVATPLILEESHGLLTKTDLGTVASLGVFCYALGKVGNGLLTDFLGGRLLFLAGMAASAVCTVVFGLAHGLMVFLLVWSVNRYVQSIGWGALVKIASRWYPVTVHASVMGVLSMSYLLGDALARLYLGQFISLGMDWRGVFFLAAGTLAALAVACAFTLKDSPRDVGAEEPAARPDNVFGPAGESSRPEGLAALLGPLLRNPTFWIVCAMNVGLTMIRETFNFWSPTYLKEAVGLTPGDAAQASMVFPLVGAGSAFVAGLASDRLQGRHGRVALPSLVLLLGALAALALTPTRGRPVLALVLVGGVSAFLIAPYSFCSGVIPLDLGGKRGSSTAAGLIDCAGYLGATLSGYAIGSVAQDHGWQASFLVLAGVAVLTLLATSAYWLHQECARSHSSPGAPPVHTDPVAFVLKLFRERGHAAYLGEPVSQLEHALQSAWAAEKAGADSPRIAAALLHDVGHLLHNLPEDCAKSGIDDRHEGLGSHWAERWFGPAVSEPIRLHVDAKRYLCAIEPAYHDGLSEASRLSLRLQGGPMTPEEVERFRQGPHAEAAVALRRWDDAAKVPGLATPDLEHFRPHLERAAGRSG
jgi:OPA family glycerol-3-phosphate transporter-like MFS transporter